MDMSLCALSLPQMWIPESYSAPVCTPGRFLMKLIGSVLPRIFGRDCIIPMSTFVILSPECLSDELCLSLVKVRLSKDMYKESVCAPASVQNSTKVKRDANNIKNLCMDVLYKF